MTTAPSIPASPPAGAMQIMGPQLPPKQHRSANPTPPQETPLTLDMMELELALDTDRISQQGFAAAVRTAARTSGGEFLFDLPSSGLIDAAQRIAIVRLGRTGTDRHYALVLLDDEGGSAKVAAPGEESSDLIRFSEAFVDVLEKLQTT